MTFVCLLVVFLCSEQGETMQSEKKLKREKKLKKKKLKRNLFSEQGKTNKV